jgi:membrane associated rhomboid family serine protease
MSSTEPEGLEATEVETCYLHPDTPTRLRCTRCDRPICGRCAIPASVGQHCPECVAEARRQQRKVRSVTAATAPATMTVIILCVGIYILQRIEPRVTFEFASIPTEIARGELWRLITAMFLHSPGLILHILFNMLVLWMYGPNVEQAFGTVRYVAMYLVCGFVASATSYSFGACDVPSVGASGAIFGIVGVLMVYAYNRRTSQFVNQYLRTLTAFIGINLVLGFVIAGVDVWAHGGGLAAGLLLGLGFDRRPALTQLATLVAVGGIGVVLVMWRTATFACAGIG